MCNLHKKKLSISLLMRRLLFVAGCFCLMTCTAYNSSLHRKMEMQDMAVVKHLPYYLLYKKPKLYFSV